MKTMWVGGLALLTLMGVEGKAQETRMDEKTTYRVDVGDVRVGAIGHSAKARTNIGGVDGTVGDSGSGSVRCGKIERIMVGKDASVTVTLPNDVGGECRGK